MNLALWIGAGLLAGVALTGGISKTFVPKQRLAAVHGGGWTAGVSAGFAARGQRRAGRDLPRPGRQGAAHAGAGRA
jgi:hypothetical protein